MVTAKTKKFASQRFPFYLEKEKKNFQTTPSITRYEIIDNIYSNILTGEQIIVLFFPCTFNLFYYFSKLFITDILTKEFVFFNLAHVEYFVFFIFLQNNLLNY